MSGGFDNSLERARSGDREALQSLLSPHLPGLAAFLRVRSGGVLGRKESVDDMVQTVCRRAISGLAGVRSDDEGQFKNWLYTLALSAVNDKLAYHGAQKRDVARETNVIDTRVADEDLLSAYGKVATPSRQAMTKEELARIEQAFAALPDEYREVISLAGLAELSRAEIAERMGKSEVAVRQLLARARARLARELSRPDESES